MNPFRQFEITGMTLSGFKCFADNTEISFGPRTIVTGGNGRGKSSVADAIAFAFTGLPFFGERGNDRLVAEQGDGLSVTVRFADEIGKEHALVRQWDKSHTGICLDGVQLRQTDVADLFGEKDVFLSIFNPLYFIEELGSDGRKLLERYLPSIPQEAVLPLLSEPARNLLESETVLSPESFLSKRREEIRELEKTAVYLAGQKDLAESQRQEASVKVSELAEKLSALEQERDSLQSRRYEGVDLSDAQERLVELSARYEEMAKEAPEASDTSEMDRRQQELQKKLAERAAEHYTPKFTEHIAALSAKVNELGAKYKRETGLLKGFHPGTVCPMCRRGVTEQELPAIHGALQQSISAVVSEGKEVSANLAEMKALEKQTEETFRRFQAEDVAKLEGELQELSRKREELALAASARSDQRSAELENLLGEIRVLSALTECGNLTPEEAGRLSACKDQIISLKAELAAAQCAAKAAQEDYDLKIQAIQDQIGEKKKQLTAMAQYVAKRAELLFSKLEMNRVKISLYDVVKSTGEVKDVFKFTYNGRRYDRLSLSEKIRAGMEVSELLKRLIGRNYPQFVDNTESVDDLANVRPTGQVIMARCVRGTALSVRTVTRPNQELPQAA